MSTSSRSDQAAEWLAKNGGQLRDAAALFGITRQAVSLAWNRKFGPRTIQKMEDIAAREKRVAELVEQGMTALEIATALGITRQTVYVALKKLGIKARRDQVRSEEFTRRARAAVDDIAAGASVVDAAIDHDVGRHIVEREMRARGIFAHPAAGRRDGRIARAIARVDAGATIPDACAAERCSTSGVYKTMKRLGATQKGPM